MKIKLPIELRRAFKILGIILIVFSLILIILSGIHESPRHEEQTVRIGSNKSYSYGTNFFQDQTVQIRYDIIEGLDTIRILIQVEDLNNDFINLTETDGREIKFVSNGDNNYKFIFLNYGNETTTIQFDIFVSAYMGNIGYFYLALICFVLSAIILVASSIKRKDISKKHEKD